MCLIQTNNSWPQGILQSLGDVASDLLLLVGDATERVCVPRTRDREI